jgi:hypothetical protein
MTATTGRTRATRETTPGSSVKRRGRWKRRVLKRVRLRMPTRARVKTAWCILVL